VKPSPPTPGWLIDRANKERRESVQLGPWARRSADSKGRQHHEEEDDLRTVYERDRDRVVHAVAFRRLMYKTQVFGNWEGDHQRTRLSHSLEVAQVARSVGNALSLNEPLCEALGLAHDIGHPPFGHRGEWALDKLMANHGGFRHNSQVLRVVDMLERRSPDYPGLNLTREMRESLLKHESDEDWPAEFRPRPKRPCLEAQVVDLADSTAYHVHDLEDGLRAKMFTEAQLEKDCRIWSGACEAVEMRHPGFLKGSKDNSLRIKRITNELLKICIHDLIDMSRRRLDRIRPKSAEDVQAAERLLVGHSRVLKPEISELHKFLHSRFYRHAYLTRFTEQAQDVLVDLFNALVANPTEMAPWYQSWCEQVGVERSVCDYVAGMTDRFAEREFQRLTGRKPPWQGQSMP
jgi:dGTPase